MDLNESERAVFLEALWGYYTVSARNGLPWRIAEADGSFDPYKILVSELMLQQTQVARVVPKYEEFLRRFPTVKALATSTMGDVLRMWQGLGYNRRAKFLWQTAQIVDDLKYFPDTFEGLVKLPGIGKNTAGAILAYAFNQPSLFIETNVRTVYIYHFFADRQEVSDKEILGLLERTIDHEHPRDFYWALMDYGTHLKSSVGNLNRISKHYAKQSVFHGSRRQVRGQALRYLGESTKTFSELAQLIPDERLTGVLEELVAEQLITQKHKRYSLD
ncbi:A/G-specific adenine glycosylase [Candidatus Saccharibacteria bacterium]|nr:MAG: A/G-specific adenine glycosylase [Candidatus Saccharibacteria bacterium]